MKIRLSVSESGVCLCHAGDRFRSKGDSYKLLCWMRALLNKEDTDPEPLLTTLL